MKTCYNMSHDETKLLSAACALQTHQTASRGTKNFKLSDHVRPYVRLYQCGYSWSDFPEIWYGELLWKSVQISKFGYSRAKISGTLHGDPSMSYCCERQCIAIQALSWNEMVSGYQDSRGCINITWTCHNATLCVRCLRTLCLLPPYKSEATTLVWVHCHRGNASECKNPNTWIFTKLHGTWNFLTSLTLRNSRGSSFISYVSLVSACKCLTSHILHG